MTRNETQHPLITSPYCYNTRPSNAVSMSC